MSNNIGSSHSLQLTTGKSELPQIHRLSLLLPEPTLTLHSHAIATIPIQIASIFIYTPKPHPLTHLPAEHPCSSHCAVVRSLWPGEASLWPAKRMSIKVQQSVLLLNAKPRVLILYLLHHLATTATIKINYYFCQHLLWSGNMPHPLLLLLLLLLHYYYYYYYIITMANEMLLL